MLHPLSELKTLLLRVLPRFLPKRAVYYINGPQTLPAPLKKQEEAAVLERLRSGDETAREELIVHNLRLVVYIAKKFESKGVDIEDLISIGTIGLIKAVNTFCPDRGIKLATYASRCIENEILMVLRKNSTSKTEVSMDEPLNMDWDGNELLLSDVLGSDPDVVHRMIEEEDERSILFRTIETLDDREKLILYMRFGVAGNREHTQKEIASLLGISQSYISRLEKRIIRKLKEEMVERIG
ncbi:MAG: RNA polymerase sporulation sigma factor SigE [Clostridia bacterium]|nr:RNA polymerase sporulation sigma factor SigE [Clostridia bacterium]